jgi:transposase
VRWTAGSPPPARALPGFVALANSIAADRAAVDAGLSTPWSTGPVEGLIHKVKLLKRQGYGRATLPLLRARVLAA